MKKNKKNYSLGSWITTYSEINVEIMCNFKFDWLNIDLEHGNISLEEAQNLIRIISIYKIKPYVRITHRSIDQIKRVLDSGAIGLIIPMVKNIEEVETIYNNCIYAPKGNRGMGLMRANMYGLNFDDYLKKFKKNFQLFIQIENINSIQNLDTILKSKKVDGVFIGPYDLTASMGIPGNFKNKKYLDSIKLIKKICKSNKIPCGIHIIEPDKEELINKINEGYKIIGFSLDTKMLENSLKKIDGFI